MAQRTQMRLHAITGSLSQIHTESLASVAAEPAAIAAEHLLDVLGEVAGSIKRIHGAPSFTEQAAGVFTHATASFSGKLDVAGMLDVNGAFDAAGAANLQSSLTVAGAADFKGDLVVTGALKVEDLTPGRVVFVGADDALVDSADLTFAASELKVVGAVSGSGNFTVGGNLEVNGTSTLDGNVDAQSGLDVTGANLTVGGANFSVDVATGNVTSAGNVSAVSGSFSGDLTVTGDLIINGTTTTINSTTITVDDKNLELGSTAVPTDTSADGGGITLKGSTDKTIIWSNTSGKWEISNGIVVAGSGSFTADVDISGDLDVDGSLTVAAIKIDGDNTPGRLYIVDADGSMKDEANLTYNSGKLLVNGAAGLEVTNATDLKSTLWVTGAADFLSTMDIVGAVQMDSTLSVDGQATFSAAINLDEAGPQSILKTGGDLYMSASADLRLQAGGEVKFVDGNRPLSWSDAEGIKLSNSAAEWANFEATFGSEVSLLAALVGGGSGGKFKAEIASTSAFVTSSAMADVAGGANFFSKWSSIVEPKIAKVDVFVNGQLMVSGTEIGSPSGVMDYAVASNGDITFSFDLVADDIVMALVR